MVAETQRLAPGRRRLRDILGPAPLRPPAFVVVAVSVGVLNTVGLVMILSASSVAALRSYGSSWYFFNRQLAWSIVGLAVFILAARIDYRRWMKLALPLLLVACATLILVLVPQVGIRVDGARRWLGVGALRFQPSELAKLALLVFAATVLTRRADSVEDFSRGAKPVIAVFLGFAALVLVEPDLDSTIVLALIALSVLAVGGVPLRQIGALALLGMVASVTLSIAAPYRRKRVLAFLNPWEDAGNTGYQIAQSLIALGSGGVDGVGLGSGRAKWAFLPNAHTDFIFAIVGEELGLIGCLIVVGLFAGFGLAGLHIARNAPDRLGMLLAAGVTSWVVGQALINMGAVIGLLPVSGIPLPFLSAGGSALVFTMAAAGILANVARQSPSADDRACTVEAARGSGPVKAARPRRQTFALVATGGTGGHVYPALSLAGALVDRGHDRSSIRFVGSRRGMEGRVVAEAGYEIDLLPGRGMQRRLTPTNLRVLLESVVALVRARLVRRYRPEVVVGFGGYASLPCVVAARIMRVPTVVHEQDAAPGLANRIATRLGARPAVSLPGTALRGAVLTGNPVRSSVAAVERAPSADPPLVAIWGGSLGARRVNEAALGLYDLWRGRGDVAVRHICGPRDHAECARRLRALRSADDGLVYDLVAYEDHMEDVYARAAVAVCRAGAGTVAELTAVGVPAVLVPLPGAPSDHQTRNSSTLAEAGAAVLLPDAECDAKRLDGLLTSLLADAARLEAMGASSRSLGRIDAAERLADFVEENADAR